MQKSGPKQNSKSTKTTTMKTNMKNFVAQQLTKKQMNEAKGGWRCLVVTKWGEGDSPNEGYWIDVPGNNANEAANNIKRPADAIGIVC